MPILPWVYWQITKDEALYPFASREWTIEEPQGRKIIENPRPWRGRHSWWRCALRQAKTALIPWTRQYVAPSGLVTLDAVMYPKRWKPSLASACLAISTNWNGHICDPDATVEGDPIAWYEHAQHIAEWDPARVDQECIMKRKLLDLHRPIADFMKKGVLFCTHDLENWPCPTVSVMADVYSHREGYGQWV